MLTSSWYRKATLRSAYPFQIYAYLRSQAGRGSPIADRAEGLLLHPSVGEDIDETAIIQETPIRFATVDLAVSGPEIRQRPLEVVEPHPEHDGMGLTDRGSVHASSIPESSVRKIGPTYQGCSIREERIDGQARFKHHDCIAIITRIGPRKI